MSISLFEAAHKGDFDFVKSKLEKDPALLKQKDSVSSKTHFLQPYISYQYLLSLQQYDSLNFFRTKGY